MAAAAPQEKFTDTYYSVTANRLGEIAKDKGLFPALSGEGCGACGPLPLWGNYQDVICDAGV